MARYGGEGFYRSGRIYRHGLVPAKPYGYGTPYRKPSPYRAADSELPVVSVGFGAGGALPWRVPAAQVAHQQLRWDTSANVAASTSLPVQEAESQREASVALPLQQLRSHLAAASLLWGEFAARALSSALLPLVQRTPHADGRSLRWEDFAEHLARLTAVPWGSPATDATSTGLAWGVLAQHALATSAAWRSLAERGAFVALPWSPIAARSSRTIIDWVVDPDPGDDPITVPIFPVYVMLPTLQVVRLPDRTPIPVLSVSLQGELGSWAWTFTAPMARAGLALIDDGTGTPTEIEVAVNGHVWTFMVDGYDDNRRFNSNTCTLRGRSRSAALAEPHAARRTYTEPDARDASQLADQELAGSGWTLVWDAPDWLVPGGTFSYQDLAPLDAIAAVANSIGAAVMSDPAAKELRVAPAYPESPWAWGTAAPFAVIPAAILTEGSSSWVGGVNANGIYVYAQNSASGALVKVAGTDGAAQLPMVVDPLAVHADAQRERGRAELAANGIKRRIQRTVPLFPPPPEGDEEAIALGVLPLGALVEFEEADETWRGQVMGVRIDAQRAGRALSVRQHLTVERQYR
jgi:hypothetical protein